VVLDEWVKTRWTGRSVFRVYVLVAGASCQREKWHEQTTNCEAVVGQHGIVDNVRECEAKTAGVRVAEQPMELPSRSGSSD